MRRGLYVVIGVLLLLVLIGVGWLLYGRVVEYEDMQVVDEVVEVEERLFIKDSSIPINKSIVGSGEYVT